MSSSPPSITKKIKQRFGWAFNDLLFSMNMGAGLHRNRQGKRIVVYHGIDESGSIKYNSRFISKTYLEHQISYFKKHYNIVTLKEYFEDDHPSDRLTIALTFDDGYANNIKYAFPILEKYQVPASFFISGVRDIGHHMLWADFLDIASTLTKRPIIVDKEVYIKDKKNVYRSAKSGISLKALCKKSDYPFIAQMKAAFPIEANPANHPKLANYWAQMDIEQIKKASRSPYITIGAHGYLHTSLAYIDHEQALEELRRSKQFLEQIIEEPVLELAYPDGSYTRELVKAAAEIGFTRQLAVDYLFEEDHQDPSLESRFGINPYISWNNQLACLLKEHY